MATTPIDTYNSPASGKYKIQKDPSADLDYKRNWEPWLTQCADTIAQVEHLVEEDDGTPTLDMTLHDSGFSGARTVVWLRGGIIGKTYRVTCRITTNNVPPRIDDRSIFVKVTQR